MWRAIDRCRESYYKLAMGPREPARTIVGRGQRGGPALALVLVLPLVASAQGQPAARSFQALVGGVPQASGDLPVRELRIRWTSIVPAGAASTTRVHSLALAGDGRSRAQIRRERQPELSRNDLVVVVQDAAGRDLDWRRVANPRILRAEVPALPGGPLTGRELERSDAEILLTIPDSPAADRVVLFGPRWTGTQWELDPIAQLSLAAAR